MQIIENWADIQGEIIGVTPHPTLDGFLTAQIRIDHVAPVSGFPNLFEEARGNTIEVNIPLPNARALSLGIGKTISSRIRKSGPTAAFVNPDMLKAR